VAVWTITAAESKETEILSYFQKLGFQYSPIGTTRSEFVLSDNVESVIDIINGLVPPKSQMTL